MQRRFLIIALLFTILQLGMGSTAGILPVSAGKLPLQVPLEPPYKVFLPVIGSSGTGVQESSFTFVSWGDTKTGTAVLASLSNQVKKLNPAFTLYMGDLENAGFTSSGITGWTAALNGNSGNGMFDITFPIRGNHDYSNTTGWQAYFTHSANAARVGAKNYSELAKNLTYSFEYGNAIFAGIDVTGDANRVSAAQVAWLDKTLASAQARGLVHAFVFFHGPVYPVDSHTTCATRTCPTDPAVLELVKVLNKHSILSAVLNGHEHVEAYVHVDSSRVPEVTRPFEQFITGSAGAGPGACSKSYRFDYCGSYAGFATITVSGKAYTVKIYKENTAAPVKTYSFSK